MKIGAPPPPQNTAFAFIPLFTYLQTRNEKHKFIAEAFVRLVMRIERPANLALQNYNELNGHYSTQPIRELQD